VPLLWLSAECVMPLRRLADEAVSPREVAALCGLPVSDIKRLLRPDPTAGAEPRSSPAADSSCGEIEEPLKSASTLQREATPGSA